MIAGMVLGDARLRARRRRHDVIRVQIAASGIARAGIASLLRANPEIEVVEGNSGGADVLIVELADFHGRLRPLRRRSILVGNYRLRLAWDGLRRLGLLL